MQRGASGPDTRSWKGDDITYYGAHERVKAQRGSASKYRCESCGGQAQEWAYDHNGQTKSEVIRGRTVAYSSDPQRYLPLCRSCHVKLDRGRGFGWPRKTECVNGHPFDEANTYIRADGERNCRTCSRERTRKAPVTR